MKQERPFFHRNMYRTFLIEKDFSIKIGDKGDIIKIPCRRYFSFKPNGINISLQFKSPQNDLYPIDLNNRAATVQELKTYLETLLESTLIPLDRLGNEERIIRTEKIQCVWTNHYFISVNFKVSCNEETYDQEDLSKLEKKLNSSSKMENIFRVINYYYDLSKKT